MQTASTAAASLSVTNGIGVEPGLAETMCEEWYRSWAIPGSCAKWGDKKDETFEDRELHPAALGRASGTHRTATELAEIEIGPDGNKIVMDETYNSPHAGTFGFNWHHSETEDECKERMREVVERVHAETPGSVLLISHGGPTSNAFRILTGSDDVVRCCGFTGLFCYIKTGHDLGVGGTGWEAPIVANDDHLQHVEGDRAGVNDTAEQTAL